MTTVIDVFHFSHDRTTSRAANWEIKIKKKSFSCKAVSLSQILGLEQSSIWVSVEVLVQVGVDCPY